jgi:hypothetical protein
VDEGTLSLLSAVVRIFIFDAEPGEAIIGNLIALDAEGVLNDFGSVTPLFEFVLDWWSQDKITLSYKGSFRRPAIFHSSFRLRSITPV